MTFKEFRKRHQGKYYRAYLDNCAYIHIIKIEPALDSYDSFSVFVDAITYEDGYITYMKGDKWVIGEEDFDEDDEIYVEVPKKVYDEHMRRYKIEREWDSQGINH